MARSRYAITENGAPHFLTWTVLNWLAVFTRPGAVQIILDALRWRQEHKGVLVYGYVILENHIHCILQADNLGRQVHDFKAFTAKAILRYLEEHNADGLLEQLASLKKPHKTDATYQFWQEGSHPQLIQNEAMLRQKSSITSTSIPCSGDMSTIPPIGDTPTPAITTGLRACCRCTPAGGKDKSPYAGGGSPSLVPMRCMGTVCRLRRIQITVPMEPMGTRGMQPIGTRGNNPK